MAVQPELPAWRNGVGGRCAGVPPEGWSDAVAIANRDDARAYRCDPAGGEVWGREGGLAEVIDALIELPAPHEPGAPRLVKAIAQRLWAPGMP